MHYADIPRRVGAAVSLDCETRCCPTVASGKALSGTVSVSRSVTVAQQRRTDFTSPRLQVSGESELLFQERVMLFQRHAGGDETICPWIRRLTSAIISEPPTVILHQSVLL